MLRQSLSLGAILVLAACGMNGNYRDTSVQMDSVAALDIERYTGKWYEIARFPNGFEEGCVGVTAEYAKREDGRISVTNTCRKDTLDGPVEVAEGIARIASPGQLKVKFVQWLPFAGDYWVLDVTPDYSVAVVGEPSGDFGWILARTPTLDDAQLQDALSVLKADGYDTSKLVYPEQPS
ncbi:lipocalin family protein [Oceanibium sediminis]|uniref:lipocalin family protein n=1 Tax=Oceanibium sediminis TaxID=2026339 RepID=UPI000DD34AF7|nr:lipocalin family protein [Oceanibium sediminis]